MSLARTLFAVKLSVGLVACLAIAADAPPGSKKADEVFGSWPQWRGPERDAKSPDQGLSNDWEARPPKLLWTADGMGGGYASVSLSGGVLYTTGDFEDGQGVIAIDAAEGKVLWSTRMTDAPPKHSREGSRSTPTIDGDKLYAIASNGKVVCLKTADGSEVWSKDFKEEWNGKMMSGWGYSESALVDGDRLICTPGGPDAMIVALDKLTGKEIWKSAVPDLGQQGKQGAGYSSIVMSNACGVKQYVQLVGRGLIGVRADDGEFLWGYNDVANRTANIPTPIITGDYVFASTGYQTGAALLKLVKKGDEIKAEEQYFLEADKFQNHHGGMILHEGHIYAGHRHNNGFPICVKLETGEIVWGGSERGPGNGSAAVCYADGHLVFRYQSGEVALIEATPEEYRLKGSFKPDYVSRNPSWALPVVIGGRLYLRDQDKLMCYDVRE
jgi:outer membrane protein assembly factor BamB